MANDKSEFLTDFINSHNPSLDKTISYPFQVYHNTLKNLLKNFTTTLFTKLNYAKIFRSHYSILSYSTFNRNKVAINLARLHLYLYDKYQTIDYSKFIEDLDLKPIMASLNYTIIYDKPNTSLFNIQSNSRFNIHITLNIPTTDFQTTFEIPSLKPFTKIFNK